MFDPIKLYVVVCEDMTPGYQAVQGLHAAVDYCMTFPDRVQKWWRTSNTVIVCSVPDKNRLLDLATRAQVHGVGYKLFYEPDVHNYTALALQPGPEAAALCATLPLALRQKKRWWRR